MQKIIRIDGMSCGHCSARVEKALSALGDVKVSVDLKAGTAAVESEALPLVCCHEGKEAVFSLLSAALRAAIEDLGFDCLSIENA